MAPVENTSHPVASTMKTLLPLTFTLSLNLVACGGAFSAGITDPPDATPDAAPEGQVDPRPDGGAPGPDGATDAPEASEGSSTEGGQTCTCTTDVPAGWTLVTFSTSGATCDGAWAGQSIALHDGMNAPAPTCDCACGAPNGVSCSIEMEDGCPGSVQNVASGTCFAQGSTGGVNFPGGGTYAVSGGACAPQPTSNIPPLTWSDNVTACGASLPIGQGSCGTGDTCVPAAPTGFKVCGMQTGDVACPFGTKSLEYTGADDTRACTTCACGTVGGVQCGGVIEEYTSADCVGTYTDMSLPVAGGGTCQGDPGSMQYVQATTGGSCAASGGTATGNAVPMGATTFCCL